MAPGYTDKTTTSQTPNATVAYVVHIFLPNCLLEYRRYIIVPGHTFVVFFHIPTAEEDNNYQADDDVKLGSVNWSNSVVLLAEEMPQTSQNNWRGAK